MSDARPETARNLVLHRLRALARANEIWLAVLAAAVGVVAGMGVALIDAITSAMHTTFFALPPGVGISQSVRLDPLRALLVPSLGGLVLGLSMAVMARFRPRTPIDPIEANALYGGRMSLTDSVLVTVQTMLSNGVGASVGLEAGYAQLGAGLASKLGQILRLRRNDLRVLVGCGAAAAIGGAFNAPLCGAFYGIELVIGVYSMANLPLVVIAALAGTLTVQALGFATPPLVVTLPQSIPDSAYVLILILGGLSGLAGIVIMRGVTLVEAGFRKSGIPLWARPALAGLVVGGLGCITPKAMSSGHSALHTYIDVAFPFFVVLGFFIIKALASAVSIGAGFRGGLFFASLFLGALLGKVFAGVLGALPFVTPLPPSLFAVVGMSGLAASVVGGPMTMTFLALESTRNFTATMAVLAASIAATLTTRRLFGYSFATWRFHLRGAAIRSAVDIGWERALTVARMMRSAPATVQGDMSLTLFRQEVPAGAVTRVVAIDDSGRYQGIIYPSEAAIVTGEDRKVAALLHHQGRFLLPGMSVREALEAFKTAEADALAVLDDAEHCHVVGLLTEQHALRRYAEELDRRNRELAGS